METKTSLGQTFSPTSYTLRPQPCRPPRFESLSIAGTHLELQIHASGGVSGPIDWGKS